MRGGALVQWQLVARRRAVRRRAPRHSTNNAVVYENARRCAVHGEPSAGFDDERGSTTFDASSALVRRAHSTARQSDAQAAFVAIARVAIASKHARSAISEPMSFRKTPFDSRSCRTALVEPARSALRTSRRSCARYPSPWIPTSSSGSPNPTTRRWCAYATISRSFSRRTSLRPSSMTQRTFGRIAAANAMSDVYAMGGQPLVALNIAGFPSKTLPLEILGEQILAAAAPRWLAKREL